MSSSVKMAFLTFRICLRYQVCFMLHRHVYGNGIVYIILYTIMHVQVSLATFQLVNF